MKKIITLLCILTAIIIACNTKSRTESFFGTPESLKADEYTITVDRDTTLVTKQGALIKIPKGTLSVDKGNTVVLDIKEAYTIQQMIAYGLHTASDGDPLSSGGMVYINAAAGQNVTINQPIKVALPTTTLQKGMQLYKGVKDEKGNINWKDPSPIADDPRLILFEQGAQLFQTKCASCHTLGKDGTGPDLAHFVNRFIQTRWIMQSGWVVGESSEFLTRHGMPVYPGFIAVNGHPEYSPADTLLRDSSNKLPEEHYDRIYAYKCNLIGKYKSSGPSFKQDKRGEEGLTGSELDMILRYTQYESNRLNLQLPSHAYLNDCIDSCGRYWETVDRINREKAGLQSKKNEMEEDNGPLVKEKHEIQPGSTTPQAAVGEPANFDDLVSPENYNSTYYQFTFETFGWYNIDILIEGVDGVKESELFVRLTGEYTEKVQIYLIIPSVKSYAQGGLTERTPGEFAFRYKNGKLPLPQNTTAYIMALSETSGSVAYALKEFTTSTNQQVGISLQAATKDEFNAAISAINDGDIKVSVADSKNAEEIRKTDAELKAVFHKLKNSESLKPKNCDCQCGTTNTPAPAAVNR
jgi:hypothetical protein